jgi:hypothetical protein
MSEFDSSIMRLSDFLRSLPQAFGIDLKIRTGGALIVASVGYKTPHFIPFERCSHLARRDDLQLDHLGEFVENSTCLSWSDTVIPLRRLEKPFELVVATESNSTGVFTRGLFLIFQ